MTDIKNYETFIKIEPVNRGLSDDKKYFVETIENRRLFLRVSDITEYDRKKADYDMMARAYEAGILTPEPVDFGLCNGGKSVYSLSSRLDGEDAESALPHMSETDQYLLGLKAGKLLKKIHAIPLPIPIPAHNDIEDWAVRFTKKLKYWFDKYNSRLDVHSETGEMIIGYLERNRTALENRTQGFIHGDYNTENIIIAPCGEVGVIDFNSYNAAYGDPWWDINNMAWMPVMYPCFYTGQIRGYFDGEPPAIFWDVLAYYLAYDALAALTDPYGLNGLEDGTEIVRNIFSWTDNFQNTMPNWYLKDFHA